MDCQGIRGLVHTYTDKLENSISSLLPEVYTIKCQMMKKKLHLSSCQFGLAILSR